MNSMKLDLSKSCKALAICLLASASCHGALAADGASADFGSRSHEIVRILEANSARLDSTYNFASLARDGLLPPVLAALNPRSPAEKACAEGPCVIKKRATSYCKALQGSACDPVTWRDYLFKGMDDTAPTLSASDADARLDANFAELNIDFKGMVLHATLESKGAISHLSQR